MSKYTRRQNALADIQVEKDLRMIISLIIKHLTLNRIDSILLGGGFGRGEGSVVFRKGAYDPLNDYDITVVTKYFKYPDPELLGKCISALDHLAEGMSVKQIDLNVMPKWKLKIQSSSIARYELKNGYKVLHGNDPQIIYSNKARNIPLEEGVKYFRTRGSGLLIAYLLINNYGKFKENERVEYAQFEINKAWIAIGDALLIKTNNYHYSYYNRSQTLSKVGTDHPIILNKYRTAVDEKLNPQHRIISREELIEEYQKVIGTFIDQFIEFEEFRFLRNFESIDGYTDFVLGRIKPIISLLKSKENKMIHKENFGYRLRFRLAVMYLLLFSANRDVSNLQSHLNILGEKHNRIDLDWKNIFIQFLSNWHPNGIIKRLI